MIDHEELSDELRKWAMKKPQPKKLLVTTVNGDERSVLIPVKPRWRDVAETVVELEPAQVQAITEAGDVIRVHNVGEVRAVRRERDNSQMEVPKELHDDPETARMTHFANIIHRAYEHSTDIAFDKLLELVERMDRRQDAMEDRVARTEAAYQAEMMARIEDMRTAAAEQGEDTQSSIVQALTRGMGMGGGAVPQANGSNGKKPTNGAS